MAVELFFPTAVGNPVGDAANYQLVLEAEMRKEDRIRQEVNRGEHEQPFTRESSTHKREQEQMKGSASNESSSKPTRQSGKLPLPE